MEYGKVPCRRSLNWQDKQQNRLTQRRKPTELREGDQRRIHSQRKLHRELGRDNARDNQNAVKEELRLLEVPFETWAIV